jgi:hypothetical protein
VDRATAIGHLPAPYAVALNLHDRGLDDRIAERLDIDPTAVPTLLLLAEAKLTRLLVEDHTSSAPVERRPSS